MFRIVTRASKDASAVKAALERFYPGWGIEVKTLKGVRKVDDMLANIYSILEEDGSKPTIILLGREDEAKIPVIEEKLPPGVVAHVVPRRSVRNARLELIAAEIARARAKFRLLAAWDDKRNIYVFGARGKRLEKLGFEPSFELFIGLGSFSRLVSVLAGGKIGDNPLVLRTHGNLHLVYNGPLVRAELEIPDYGVAPRARIVGSKPVSVSLDSLVDANRETIDLLASYSKEFLLGLGEFDTVIVPWSGGKDSTAALLLAIEAFGADKVTALYVDTGTEFPSSKSYVYEVAEKLGVKLVEAYAGIDKELLSGSMPMPSHDNRWCTGLKIEAIEKKVRELARGRTLLVIGDRDAESPRRSQRPPVRPGPASNVIAAAPLKMWSGAHIQLYILSRGLRLNPMYYAGFYRIGCYMCPALRSWELLAISEYRKEYLRLLRSPIFRRFISMRLRRRYKHGFDSEGCDADSVAICSQ
ncbi:phosphoadenosine phosphosulfate reductase family protein [Pyrofollis japonicus]|uniref:phosphoadenosine phosphosulfate reductase domain-containing protein n=1 Tax=Pyrofollis japonicus TaxID=3060460 RepID=UPI00295B772A|nr:phosphoadenosine phosphosulfate reductase family protein [Pyrofollis japonicus]BEP18660.1 phosphoadenosine phosphosulfate reductase family protein [Pyrofollis japonicus]